MDSYLQILTLDNDLCAASIVLTSVRTGEYNECQVWMTVHCDNYAQPEM